MNRKLISNESTIEPKIGYSRAIVNGLARTESHLGN